MTGYCIVLGDGRRVSLGNYVAAWKRASASPRGTTFKGSPCGDYRISYDRETILREFRDGLHDRINRHVPGYGKGRKWSSDWQRHALQCSIAVNTPRLVVWWVPPDFKKRLAHRIKTVDPDDYL